MDISPTVNGELRYYGSEQLELMQALEMLAQKPGAKLWIRNHVARCVVMLRKWQRDSYEHGITEQKELDQYESEIKVLKLELQKAKTDKQTDRVNDLDRRLEKVPLKNDRVKPPMLWNEVPGSLIWDQMCDADRLAVACGTLVAFFVVHDKRFAKELFFRNPVKSEKPVRQNYTKRTLTVCAVPLALDTALEYFELVSKTWAEEHAALPAGIALNDDPEWQPASWFGKGKLLARLKMAAQSNRKNKRVRVTDIDGVRFYSLADARMWWSRDIHK